MTGRYFDNSHHKSDDVNTSITNGFHMTNNDHTTDPECDQPESDMTRFIRDSMERSEKYDSDHSTSTIKQVVGISSNVISRIPFFLSHADHAIRKAISVGKEGIHTVTDLKNSIYPIKRD